MDKVYVFFAFLIMRITVLLLFLIKTSIVCSQNHDFHWPFGYFHGSSDPNFGGGIMSFKEDPPIAISAPLNVDFSFYCGACSDSSGQNLLFYTNGLSIQNANHEIMQNGNKINPGEIWNESAFQTLAYYPGSEGSVVLPAPNYKDRYYLFHVGLKYDSLGYFLDQPFYYSYINMQAENGLGRVLKKNQILLDSIEVSRFAFVKHGNGRDWWVLMPEYTKPYYYRFLLSPDGVTGPFLQAIGPDFPLSEGGGNKIFTPDGNTYIRLDARNGLWIFDFDRCTGLLSNLRLVPFVNGFYAISQSVSPDSRFLYLNSIDAMMQVDLKAADIGASLDTLQTWNLGAAPLDGNFHAFNLAPDGKLYGTNFTSSRYLHRLNRPNLPGHAADYEQLTMKLPRFICGTICQFPNYRLGSWETSPCDTLPPGLVPGFINTAYLPYVEDSSSCKVYTALGRNFPKRSVDPSPLLPSDPRSPHYLTWLDFQRSAVWKAKFDKKK